MDSDIKTAFSRIKREQEKLRKDIAQVKSLVEQILELLESRPARRQ
jgi:ABC-type transporter MlaC component